MSRSGLAASLLSRRSLLLAPVLALGLSLLSCGREVTGPDGGIRQAVFGLAPTFPAAFAVEGSGDVVPFNRVRITLDRLDNTRLLTRVVDFPADEESVQLDLEVDLPFGTTSGGIDLILNMQYINAAGDTVFRAGPQTVTALPSDEGEPTPIVPVEVEYVGPGADAAFMDMAPAAGTVMAGTTTQFSATAYDPNETEIPNTPFVFSSPDATRVTITPQGLATWLAERGTARIIATLPTGELADTTTFTVSLPASLLQVVSGGGQSAQAGAPLAQPVVLRVAAADAMPVAGMTVTFTVATGGGTIEPASAVSDANGLVSFAWTLGATVGAQTVTATYAGLAAPLTIAATAGEAPAGGVVVWTGAVSNNWSVAGNWDTGVVPSPSDSAVIPAVSTQPILTAPTTVGAVNVSAGTLWLNGQTLVVLRDFATTGSGVLVMQEEAAALSVGGNARFAGGNEGGLLSLGALLLNGNFTQVGTNSTASFQASAGFTTALQSASPVIVFENPGPGPGDSRFGDLVWIGGGTLTQQSGMTVSGTYAISSATPATQVGIGGTLGRYLEFGTFFNSAPVTFDNVRVLVTQEPGADEPVTITNATWRNLPGDASRLIINHPGGSSITLDNVVFESAPTTGFYITATDNAPTDGMALVVSVANATPATPGTFTSVAGGATIEWPAGSARLWIGSVSTDWDDAANWSPAAVPGALDAVTIFPTGGNMPVLASTTAIGNLSVAADASLSLVAGGILTVNGNIAADGTILVDELNGALRAAGIGRTVRGSIQNLLVTGSYTLSDILNVSNDLIVTGSLNPAGWPLNTVDLIMNSAGVLIMQDAEDLVTVTGQAMFTGGATEGLLTDGVLRVGGRLVANTNGTGNPQNSFAASGDHVVLPIGAGPVEIDILTGGLGAGTSHFANLDLSQLGGSVNFTRSNTTYLTGLLVSQPGGPAGTISTSVGAQLHATGVNVSGLNVNAVRITTGGGDLQQFDNVTFSGHLPTDTQLTIDNPGSVQAFTMSGLSFGTSPATGGRYVAANDTDGATPNALVINLTNPDPATSGGFIATTNGAVINWPTGAPVRLWTGSTSSAWNNAANWQDGVIPASTDSVRIAAGANFGAMLVQNTVIAGLTVESGGSLDLDTWVLTVQGSVVLPPTPSIIAAGMEQFELQAAGAATVRGVLPGTVVDNGVYTLAAPVSVSGDLQVRNNGHLSVSDFAVQVSGSLATTGNGVLAMSGPANMEVGGNATFSGGSTAGLITGGTLIVGGQFAQGGTSPQAFQAGQGHTVELNGAVSQSVNLQDPDVALNTTCSASCFGTLRTNRPLGGGSIQFVSSAKAVTAMDLTAPDGILAGTNLLVSGGTPTFSGGAIQASAIAFESGLVRNAETFAVDSLFGFGNDFTLPAGLTTPTRIVGRYFLSAAHNAGLVVGFNALDVAGVATVNGPLVLNASGWLRMQEPGDTLIVNGSMTVSGTSPISQLTAGVLQINGDFAQTAVGVPSFNADPGHKTRFTGGAGSTIQFVDASTNRFGTIEFSTGGLQILSPANMTGDVIVQTSSTGPVTGTVGQLVVVNGGLYDTLGGTWQVPVTRFTSSPNLPDVIGGGVEFAGTVTLQHDMTINGTLALGGTAELVLGGHRLSVLGDFSSVGNSHVVMANASDTLSLSGSASFGGGTSASLMTNGTLELYGNFAQSGNAASFAPSGLHETWFFGTAPQSVSFANPGSGPGLSHFNHVGLAQGTEGISVGLLSDAWADGQLQTIPASSRRLSAATRQVFHSRGADVQADVDFVNVGWALVDGAPVAPINGLSFSSMDATQVQFTIQRSGGAVAINTLDFSTVPNESFYMGVTDPDGATGGALEVQITGVTPATHGGFLQVNAPATVTGWPESPAAVWQGNVNGLWDTAANWSTGVVPGPADSVYVPPAPTTALEFPTAPLTLRAFVSEYTGVMNLPVQLTITRTLNVPFGPNFLCDGGQIVLAGDALPVRVQGRTPCFTRVIQGTAVASGDLRIDNDLQVEGVAVFDVNRNRVAVGGNFSTLGNGRLRMMDVADSLAITGGATFSGASTAGLLTAGVIGLEGNFDQRDGSPEAFAASGTHSMEFYGFVDQQVSFQNPGTAGAGSHFANVKVLPNQLGAAVLLNSAVFADGQLVTDPDYAPILRDNTPGETAVTFTTWGANVDGFTFDNVRWVVEDGAAIDRIDNVVFANMYLAAHQLTMRRRADVLTLNGIQFYPNIDGGLFLVLDDVDGGAVFTVTMQGTTPTNRGAFTSQLNGAQLLGWDP